VKRTWILVPALVVLVGLGIATAFALRSPAYHARFVSEGEISLVNNQVVARGHARALLDATAIATLGMLGDPRTLDALTARAVPLREEIEALPPEMRWHPWGRISPAPKDRELRTILYVIAKIDRDAGVLLISLHDPWEVELERVQSCRRMFEEKRAKLPPQVLPR
jgi:hypothetical protein